MLMKASTQS